MHIADEAIAAMKHLIITRPAVLVEEELGNILRVLYCQPQKRIREIVHNNVGNVVFDLLRKEIIGQSRYT